MISCFRLLTDCLQANGRCGDAGSGFSKTPQLVEGLEAVKQIACAGAHTLALQEDGRVFSWGSGAAGQLGHGTMNDSAVPKQVGGGMPRGPCDLGRHRWWDSLKFVAPKSALGVTTR